MRSGRSSIVIIWTLIAAVLCLIIMKSPDARQPKMVSSPSIYLDAGEKIDFAAEKQAEYREIAEAGKAVDSDFISFNTTATSYYIHTYDSAYVAQ